MSLRLSTLYPTAYSRVCKILDSNSTIHSLASFVQSDLHQHDKVSTSNVHVVIALVNGHVVGGACGLLACTDYVWARESAILTCPEMFLGLPPIQIQPYIQARLGEKLTKQLLFSGGKLAVHSLCENGFIDVVVANPEDQLHLWLRQCSSSHRSAHCVMKQHTRSALVTPTWRDQAANAFAGQFAKAYKSGLLDRFVRHKQ